MASSTPFQIMLVDQHPVSLSGWVALIQHCKDMEICASSSSRAECISAIHSFQPDLVVVDPTLPDMDAIELIRLIAQRLPHARILVCTAMDLNEYAHRMREAGASAFLPKTTPPVHLLSSIRTLLTGQPDTLHDFRLPPSNSSALSYVNCLSDRELELFRFLGKGYPTPQIAEAMQLSEHTVHAYRLRIKKKLGLADTAQLAQLAIAWEERQH